MASSATTPSRRERLRAQTLAEIREHGYAQIAEGGPTALSLNGIAKAMGMSGPSLYRYFASRDELLATLVTESYEDLARTLADAQLGASRRPPEGQLRAVVHAFRDWALRSPHRYRLVFGSTYGSGALDPDRIIPPANRAMSVILATLAEINPGDNAPSVTDTVLKRQLDAWGSRRGPGDAPLPSGVLLLGLLTWTRIHGIVSLEIEGVFEQVDVDPARLYSIEIDHLITQRSEPRAGPHLE
jgi:AcrR family transcriptional regulator